MRKFFQKEIFSMSFIYQISLENLYMIRGGFKFKIQRFFCVIFKNLSLISPVMLMRFIYVNWQDFRYLCNFFGILFMSISRNLKSSSCEALGVPLGIPSEVPPRIHKIKWDFSLLSLWGTLYSFEDIFGISLQFLAQFVRFFFQFNLICLETLKHLGLIQMYLQKLLLKYQERSKISRFYLLNFRQMFFPIFVQVFL